MIHLFDKMRNCIDVHGFDFLVVYNILKRSVGLYSVLCITSLYRCTVLGPVQAVCAQSQNVPGRGRTQDKSQCYHPPLGAPAGSVPLITSLIGQHRNQQEVSAGNKVKYSVRYFSPIPRIFFWLACHCWLVRK